MKALIIFVAAILPLATAAGGDRPGPDKQSASAEATFKSLDRNSDRSISKVEAKADRAVAAAFDTADINLDGYITKAEYVAYVQRTSGAPTTQDQPIQR
jgi:hypothetical protein